MKKNKRLSKEKERGYRCRICKEPLTRYNTSRNFIENKNHVCFKCLTKRRHSITELEQLYDPFKNEMHEYVDNQSCKAADKMEILERTITEEELKYPTPKGKVFKMNGEICKCPECGIVLTTTNTSENKIQNSWFLCNPCANIQREMLAKDPLYLLKKELKSIVLELYSRRKNPQFEWKYVENRFSIPGISPALPIPATQIPNKYHMDSSTYIRLVTFFNDEDKNGTPTKNGTEHVQKTWMTPPTQEEKDRCTKLFGIEYTNKRWPEPKPSALQYSFGDLTSEQNLKKLISFFRWELSKSKRTGWRNQQKKRAKNYLLKYDPEYSTSIFNSSDGMGDETSTYDPAYAKAYCGSKFIDPKTYEKKWNIGG